MTAPMRYRWPGNIRELQNFIERSVIPTKGTELRAPVAELVNNDLATCSVRTLADADKAHIISTLRRTNWVVGGRNGAAAKLGLNRTTILAKMRKLGISRETTEPRAEGLESYTEAAASSFATLV